MRSTARLISKLPSYWCFRTFGRPTLLPFNYTLSITHVCNSRCKTCNIWEVQHRIPVEMELALDEWSKVLKSLGDSPYWITISGGEPFLHNDLVEIIRMIDEYNQPKIVNIPTNGTLWRVIPKKVAEVLEVISPQTALVINFSLDEIGRDHDEIRGVRGNYSYLVRAYKETMKLKDEYRNLVVGIHTVISSWNVRKIPTIYETVLKEFGPDQYITEIAEERNEMDNQGQGITPPPEEYGKAVSYLENCIGEGFRGRKWKGLARITEAFRMQYYTLAASYYKTGKGQIPSYAGYASAQITPTGEVWECAAYGTSMGNVRECNYDFRKLWCSKKARYVREKVRRGHLCPLANESYTNMLFDLRTLVKVAWQYSTTS